MSRGCAEVAIFLRSEAGLFEDGFIADWAQSVDRAQSASLMHPAGVQRFLLGRSLIRALVARRTGENGRDCRILTDPNGKPSVRLGSGKQGPEISLSHSGSMIVAAATELGPVGVDVEFHKRNRSFDAIAAIAFGPDERRAASESLRAFYRIWCLREAMSKATGRGLTEVADGVDRSLGGLTEGAWVLKRNAGCWLLAHREPAADYSLAIAVQCTGAEPPQWTEASLDIWRPS